MLKNDNEKNVLALVEWLRRTYEAAESEVEKREKKIDVLTKRLRQCKESNKALSARNKHLMAVVDCQERHLSYVVERPTLEELTNMESL